MRAAPVLGWTPGHVTEGHAMHARIRLGAEVLCDGGKGGHLDGVVLDPEHRHVEHLVIRGPDAHRHVIPAQLIAEAHHDHVKLAMTPDELVAAPRYRATDLSLPGSPHAPPSALDPDELLVPMEGDRSTIPVPTPPQPVEHLAVPSGGIAVEAGTPVHCTDQACGHVAEVLFDPVTAHAAGLLVRRGFAWARDVELPMGWLDHADEAGLHLKMTAQQVDELARYYPREHP